MITNLNRRDIGRWIYYMGLAGEREGGKIKSFNNESRTAWVVFKCDGNWDHYETYTGESVNYDDLFWPAWVDGARA